MDGTRAAGLLAVVLLLSLPAFAETSECPPAGATDGGVAGPAEGCPDPHGPLTPDTRGLDSNWEDIQLDQRLDKLGVHPSEGSEPLEGTANEPQPSRLPPNTPEPQPNSKPSPPEVASTWTVDLDAVAGQSHTAGLASVLMTARVRLGGKMGLGLIVPFSFGVLPDGAAFGCYGVGCPRGGATVGLGNIASCWTWEAVQEPNTRLVVGLVLAFPGWLGLTYIPIFNDAVSLTGPTRGFEDMEFFLGPVGGIEPSLAVSHGIGPVELTATARTGFFLGVVERSPGLLLGGLGTAQVMFRVLQQGHSRVSVGLRALGAVWVLKDLGEGYAADYNADGTVMYPTSIAVEPRVDAHFGGLELRAGFIIPIAYRETQRDGVLFFPSAWGVRAGAGYTF